jgi:hypothetical protein
VPNVTVPTYGSPNVQQAALPGARLGVQASPGTFGAGAARGAVDLAQSGLDIQEQERAKADQVRMLDLERKLGEWENAKLYDPNTGAFSKRGEDAFGLPESVGQDFDGFAGDLQTGLTSDRQRLAAQQLIESRRTGIQRSLMNHVAGEQRNVEDQALAGVVATEDSAAIANYNDPERVAQAAARKRMAIEGHARRNGLPPEAVAAAVAESTSRTYAGAIGRMIDRGDDLAAKDALERWKGDLTGEDAARIDGALKVSSTKAESRGIADEVSRAPDLQSALAALDQRKIADTDVYDQTRSRVVAHYQLERQADQEHQEGIVQDATDRIDADKTGAALEDLIPPQQWAQLRPSYRKQLQTYRRGNVQTDWGVYYDLRDAATDPAKREQFKDADLFKARGVLADPEWKELLNLRDAARGKESAGTKKDMARITSLDDVFKETLSKAGIDPRPIIKGTVNEPAVRFREQFEKQLAAHAQLTGKEATPTDARAIADKLLIEQTVTVPYDSSKHWIREIFRPPGLGYTPTTERVTARAFDLPYMDRTAYTVDQIPAADLQQLRADFAAAGDPQPDPVRLVNAYNAILREGADGR